MTRKANHKKLFSKTDCASKVISTISYTYLSSIKNKKCLEHHFVFKISWFCQSFSMFAFVVQMLNQWILFGLLQEGNGIRTLESSSPRFCLREEERLDEFFEKKTSIAKGSSMVSLATNSREPFTRFILGGFFFWADQSGTTSFWRHFLKSSRIVYILIYEKDNWIYISVHFTINLSDKIDLKIGFLLKKLDTLEYIMDIFGYGRPKRKGLFIQESRR